MVLLTGEQPGSERETEALCQVDPSDSSGVGGSLSRSGLACIEDPGHSPLGRWLGRRLLPAAGGQRGLRHAGPLAAGAPISDSLHHRGACWSPADEATERYLPGDDRPAALVGLKMKHAGAEPAVPAQRPPPAMSGRRGQRRRASGARGSAAAIPREVQSIQPSIRSNSCRSASPARASASVRPPVLSSLILIIS